VFSARGRRTADAPEQPGLQAARAAISVNEDECEDDQDDHGCGKYTELP
jgi:hypothetical protein